MSYPMFFVSAPEGGRVGLAPMPGRMAALGRDIAAMSDEGVGLLLSMATTVELPPGLGSRLAAADIGWDHLPIADWNAPAPETEAAWPQAAARAHALLDGGGTVLAHCMGGHGRSGLAVMRLLVERGMEPGMALGAIRAVRPGAVETEAQQAWAARGVAR